MDNFFKNIFRKREVQPSAPAETVGVPSSSTDTKASGTGNYQERLVYVRGPHAALTVSAVYRATNLRADTMGIMPVQFRKKDFEGGNFVVDMRGLGKRLNYMLQEEPNPIMTATDMWRLVETNRLLYGNAFVYIERDEFGLPFHLWLVREGGYNIVTGTYASIVYLSDQGYRTLVNVPRDDVMHFPNIFRRLDNMWGISTLQYAIESLSLNKTLRAQALETSAKGGRVKLIIGEERQQGVGGILSGGLYNKQQLNDYANEVNDRIYQKDVVAIRGLDKVQNISMSAAEMQALEQTWLTYDDVARFWGVPRPLLMLDTNSHYNDYQNATMEFHTRTILPQKTGNEKEIARKLIGFKDYGTRDIHICEDPLMVMDPERRAKVAQLKMQAGICTVNEARRDFDMPAVEDGDVPMASANLMTLKALIAKSDASTQLKPGNYTVGEPPKEGEETA